MKHLLALALCVTLIACGGGGDPAPSAAPQSAPPAAAPATIQLFGDSTLRMVGFELVKVYGSRIDNRAVNGSTSTQLIAGTDGLNARWPASVAADVVVIGHGLNDGFAAHQVLTQDEYRANLEQLVDLAPAGVRVVLQTPLPSTAPGRDMAAYAETMRDVARVRGLHVIDVFACFGTAPDYASLFKDGTHPTDAGLQVMVACMRPTLDAL